MKRLPTSWLALFAVASVSAAATVHFAGGGNRAAASASASAPPVRSVAKPRFPSAAEFGRVLVGTTNQFAAASGDSRRIGRQHCVQGVPGSYMCAYSSKRPGEQRECHLMQGRWTPEEESTITITLGGRTARCGSVWDAVDSLE